MEPRDQSRSLTRLLTVALRQRNLNSKDGSFTNLAGYRNLALVSVDNPFCNGQAEPSSA